MKKKNQEIVILELRNDTDRTCGVGAGVELMPSPRTSPLTLAERRQLEIDVQASLDRVGVKR